MTRTRTYVLSLFLAAFLFPVYVASGQALTEAEQSRLDARFQAVVADAFPDAGFAATGVTPEPVEPAGLAKDGETRYAAAIYTRDVSSLRQAGITVNSTMSDFVTARVTAADLRTLAQLSDVKWVDSGMTLYPTNDVAAGATGADALQSGFLNNTSYTGQGAMVCVIDTGIDWDHEDFRTGGNLGNSKIRYVWDQTLSPQTGEQTPAQRGDSDLSGYDFGVEYSKTDIEGAFGQSSPGVRTEDTDGHGTHVAGTAVSAGNAHPEEKYEGMAPDADLIVVKAGNGSFSFANVIDGMNYCGEVADDEGKPVVVNMSLGSPAGPHDGTSAVAQAVDGFVGNGQMAVVSAGNDGSSGMHYQGTLASGGSASFDFAVGSYTPRSGAGNDDADFDIWFSSSDSASVTVTSPNGYSHTVPVDSASTQTTDDGAIFLSNQVSGLNNDRHIQISVFDRDANKTPAPGTWTVTFTDTGVTGGSDTFHSWFYDRNIGTNTADSPVRISGNEVSAAPQVFAANYTQGGDSRYTIGTPGTAKGALTVGAWTHRWRWQDFLGRSFFWPGESTGDIASFSSVGPLRDGTLKPEITAPGRLMASARSGDDPINTASDSSFTLPGKEHVLLQGTSMSAPAVAGGVALLFQEDGGLSGTRIKTLISRQADSDGFTGSTPNNAWGHGKLDIFRAMAELTGSKVPEREMLAYDADAPSTSRTQETVGGSNAEKVAVRITPNIGGSITGALLHLSVGDANQLSDSLNVEVWSDNGNGFPGTKQGNTVKVPPQALASHSWNFIPLTGTGVSVAQNTDYHVVLYPDDPADSLRVYAENQAVDGRSSILSSGTTSRLESYEMNDSEEWAAPKQSQQASWSTLSTKDLSVRAVVSSTQPTNLDVNISSLDFKLLNPSLPTPVQFVAGVSVENNGEPVQNLTAGDFTVTEEGTNVPVAGNPAKNCKLTLPGQGRNTRLADIVFVVDNSGSMGFEQDDVVNNIEDFVDELRARGVNSAFGLTRYGQSATGELGQTDGGPIFENQGNLATNDQFFKNQILTRNVTGGGTEPGYFAVEQAVENFTFRSGAKKVFVVATDETPAQETQLADVDDARQAIVNSGVSLYAATESGLFDDFQPLTDATGGQSFDIFDPFATTVADAITGQTSSTYIFTCRSPSDFEGSSISTTERGVDVTATASGVMATATDTFDISSRPRVVPSQQLKQVASTQQPSDQDLDVQTSIQTFGSGGSNAFAKQANVNAEIFYRQAGSTASYTSVPMSENSSGTFVGAIPQADVRSPGMEFYIQATDGDGDRVTLPSSNAATNPIKTAVAPNEPPTVNHDLVAGTTPGQDKTLTATATDDGQVSQVTLYYRMQGDLAYSQLSMTNTSDSTFEATVPGSEITAAGIEYYVEAEDDFGVTNSVGLADDPLVELSEPGVVAPTASNRTLGLPTSIDVTFNSVFRALEYEVQWSQDAAFPAASTNTKVVTDTTTTLNGLSTGTTYHWRVRPVRNEAGPYSDTTQFATYADEIQASVSQAFSDPTQTTSYRLMALPGDRGTGLASALDGANGEGWQAYRDDGSSLISYEDGQASNFTFEPGAGYWVLSTNDVSVSDTKPTVDIGNANGDFETTIPLHDGWNIISNPLGRDVAWSAVSSANGGSLQALWAFDGSYSQVPTFASAKSGQAFYFLNNQDLSELVIPYPSTGGTSSASKQVESPALVLETFQDGEKTSVAKAGLRASAEDGLDPHDQFAPPARFEAAALRFVVDEEAKAAGSASRRPLLAHEYQSAPEDRASAKGHAFDVRLTAKPDTPVKIKVSGLDAFEGQAVVLLNPSTGQSYDLRGKDYVRITPTSKSTSLRLLAGDTQFVDSKKQKVIPDEVKLHGNYPNPVTQQTTITYVLPEKQHHRVEIYDVLGRQIAVLADGTKRAGVHRVQWSGQNDGGGRVASGVYIIRLEAKTTTQVKKMTVVR